MARSLTFKFRANTIMFQESEEASFDGGLIMNDFPQWKVQKRREYLYWQSIYSNLTRKSPHMCVQGFASAEFGINVLFLSLLPSAQLSCHSLYFSIAS
jgi:hypothetical protein